MSNKLTEQQLIEVREYVFKKAENVENPYIYIEKDVDGSLYKEVMTEEEFKEYYNSFGETLLKLTIKG